MARAAKDSSGRDGGRSRFRRAALVGALLTGLLFVWLATMGTFNPLYREAADPGGFSDAQVRAWFDGHWDVEPGELGIEAFVIDGKEYAYFGPAPALLRVPFLAASDWFDHRLGALSLITAFGFTMAGTTALSWRVRRLMRGDDAPYRRSDSVAAFATTLIVGAGSVVLHLGVKAWAYQEAVLWGVAGTVWAFAFLVEHVRSPSMRALGLATFAATWAFMSRGAGGVASVVALALLAGVAICQAVSARWSWSPARRLLDLPGRAFQVPRLPLVASIASVLVPAVTYTSVNYVKFGSLFRLPIDSQTTINAMIPSRVEALEANGGSLFGPEFVPTNLLHYLRPDGFEIRRLFPFFYAPRGAPTILNGATFDGYEPSAAMSIAMPVVFGFAVVGTALIIRGRRRGDVSGPAVLRVLLLGAVAGTLAAISIAWNTERYQGDFMPLLLLAGLVALHALLRRLAKPAASRVSRWLRRAGAVALVVLVPWSMWAQFSLGFYDQRYFFYDGSHSRHDFLSFQYELDDRLFGDLPPPDVRQGDGELPLDAAVGDLFIVGDCDGLYAGRAAFVRTEPWMVWEGVERSSGTGGFRLKMDYPEDPPAGQVEPLLVSGPPGDRMVMAIEYRGYGVARILQGVERTAEWYKGNLFNMHDGEVLALSFDRRTLVSVAATEYQTILTQYFWIPHPDPDIDVGTGGFWPMTTPSFSGEIEQLDNPTPLCDRLLERLRQG